MTSNRKAAFSRGDLPRRIDELEEKVARMQTARRLEAASIGAGGLAVKGGSIVIYDTAGVETMRLSTDGLTLEGLLTVIGNIQVAGGTIEIRDANDNVQVRLGALTSTSGFGLEQLVGSTFVPLAALAGGAVPDVVPDEESLIESAGSSTSYENLDTVGPSVTFTTYTGKWLILLVAHAGVSTETAARMSYSASGEQSVSAADARSSLLTDPGTAMGIQNSVIYANVHTGAPGEITVTAKYRCIPPAAGPPANGVASWQNRALIVIPY